MFPTSKNDNCNVGDVRHDKEHTLDEGDLFVDNHEQHGQGASCEECDITEEWCTAHFERHDDSHGPNDNGCDERGPTYTEIIETQDE